MPVDVTPLYFHIFMYLTNMCSWYTFRRHRLLFFTMKLNKINIHLDVKSVLFVDTKLCLC